MEEATADEQKKVDALVATAEKQRRAAFLLRSFLMLRERLSFSRAGRGTFGSGPPKPGLEAFDTATHCSFCGTVQRPYKEKRGRDYLIDASGTKIPLPRPEGVDWVQREVIDDVGQLGRWDAPPVPRRDAAGGDDSDLSDSDGEEEELVPGVGNGKRGDKPCLGLLQRLTLCPKHESACSSMLGDATLSTVLVKSQLWAALEEFEAQRRAHRWRHLVAAA